MKKNHTALDTSLLPQYQGSNAFMERFLIAAHQEGAPVERSANNTKIKLIDETELEADVLEYFTDGKDDFRKEFTEELRGRLVEGEFELFCSVIAEEWIDGKRLRENGSSGRLKRSVYDYLSKISLGTIPSEFVQVDDYLVNIEPLISIEAIATILTINDQMIHRHVEAWKQLHPDSDKLSDGDIYLRRGLALKQPFDTTKPYREWDFINSYSIAISSPEKFSQMMKGRQPALVNGDLALFEGRVLFFSPFIPGMDVGQLEFGIIPSERPLPIHYQGTHANVMEYILDPPHFHTDDQ